jgi:isoleucyl-tRNA synthetase
MSKSLGNAVALEDVIAKSGADILRVWVAASEYTQDLSIGPNILKQHEDTYRRLRNTLRYLCGALDGFDDRERLPRADMPELERFVLHRLWELDALVRRACDDFDFHALFTALHNFCAVELSAFYFDIRKDSLYCDRPDALRRRAARTVMAELYSCLTAWLAPILCFTADEAWLARNPGEGESVHLRTFPAIPPDWRDDALAAKWRRVRDMRRTVTGALEKARADKKIGSSLEARPILFAGDGAPEVDWAEVCITSDIEVRREAPPAGAEILPDLPGVGALFGIATGAKCTRCWKVLPEVGTVPAHPELCVRCADAVDHALAGAK